MKLDLDDIELRARGHVATGITVSVSGVTQFAAVGSTPEETLALITRIRELEAAIIEVRNELRDGCVGQRDLDALLEKGAVLP